MNKETGTLHKDQCTVMIVRAQHRILLRMRNVSDKSYREKSKHILCSVIYFSKIVPFMRCGKIL
jgi:hypothetical protein